MGLGYMNILIEFLRDKILGQKSPQPEQSHAQSNAGAGTASYASYASDLLSRFAMPGARTNEPNPRGTTSANVYSMVSNLAGAAFAGSAAPRSATHEASSIPGSLVDTIPGSTSSEKANYISAQRERLSTLLKALDREQQSLDMAYGSAPTYNRPPSSSSGASGLKTKSRSEVSFENVDYDEATERVHTPGSTPPKLATESPQARRTTSGNWLPAGMGGWFGGGNTSSAKDRTETGRDTDEQSSTASKGWSAARDITEEMARGMSSGVDTDR